MLLSAVLMAAASASTHHGAVFDAKLVAAQNSAACGGSTGLFAASEVAAGARLVAVPVERCITAAAALRHGVLGPRLRARFGAALDYAQHRVATRALIARVKYAAPVDDDEEWRAYVESLPWEEDCVVVPDEWRAAADLVADLAEVTREEAFRAIRLIRSRAMNLGRDADDAERLHAMVPFVDLFNHPGLAALRASGAAEAFFKTSVSDSCVTWYLSEDRSEVLVDAPSGLRTPAGSELWLWCVGGVEWTPRRASEGSASPRYGDAGVDTGGGPFNETKHAAFVDAYGFDPWAE